MAEQIFFAVEVDTGKAIPSLASLQKAIISTRESQKQLNKDFKSGKISLDEYAKATNANKLATKSLNSEYNKSSKAVTGLNKNLTLSDKISQGLTNSFKTLGVTLGAAFAVKVISDFGKKLLEVTSDFQKAVAELSAITGAAGEDLEFLSDKAIELSNNSTKSSQEIITAFKLIASAKPELLENAEALAELTEQSIILSEASGLDLTVAAEQLGAALNALNLPAEEAGRVINVLAAASQLGTREIPFLNDALSKFGGIAAQAGVSIEESAAAVEILGKAIPEAATVGTNLRNVLTILQVEAEKSGREFQGLTGELELLAPDLNNITKLNKVFGRENLLAVQTLIAQRDSVTDLQAAITGTNAAFEQAEINSATLSAAQEKLSNSFDNLLLSIGTEGAGSLTGILDDISQGMNNLTNDTSILEDEFSVFGTIVQALKFSLDVFLATWRALLIPFREGFKLFKAFGVFLADIFQPQIEAIGNVFNTTILPVFTKLRDTLVDTGKAILAFGGDILKKFGIDVDLGAKAVSLFNEVLGINEEKTKDGSNATSKNTDIIDDNTKSKELNTVATKESTKAISDQEAVEESFHFRKLQRDDEAIDSLQEVAEAQLKAAEEEEKLQMEAFIRQNDAKQREIEAAVLEDEQRTQRTQSLLDSAQTFADSINTIASIANDNKLRDLDKSHKAELAAINQKERDGLIDRDEADQARRALDEKSDKAAQELLKKQFQRDKIFSIAQIAISTARAVATASANPPGPPFSIPQAVAAGVLGAAQITAVAVQKFEQGGILQGPSHAQGGIPLGGGNEAEGGEAIINTTSTAMFRDVLSDINVAGGGRAFQSGGILPNVTPTVGTSNRELLSALDNIDINPIVSVVEIETARTNVKVGEIESSI